MTSSGLANECVIELAPDSWFHDRHGSVDRPRCCEAIACVQLSLEAVPEWTQDDARELARAVVGGIGRLPQP